MTDGIGPQGETELGMSAMRPQAYDPDDPADGEDKGTRVTVELWVSSRIEDPTSYVRERVLRDTETAYADVAILNVWQEDPE